MTADWPTQPNLDCDVLVPAAAVRREPVPDAYFYEHRVITPCFGADVIVNVQMEADALLQ